jgi:hypothetical protein
MFFSSFFAIIMNHSIAAIYRSSKKSAVLREHGPGKTNFWSLKHPGICGSNGVGTMCNNQFNLNFDLSFS